MWGIRNRGARISAELGARRALEVGLVRAVAHGPAEHTIVHLTGDLDFASAPAVVDYIQSLPGNVVAIDVSSLDFIDSTGVMLLDVLCRKLSQGREQTVELVRVPATLRRTFELVSRELQVRQL